MPVNNQINELPKVAIILLNWNGWKDTIECIESIFQNEYSNFWVIILDNYSQDESIKNIKKYADGKIEVKSTFYDYLPSNKPFNVVEYTIKELEKDNLKKTINIKDLIIIKNDENSGFATGNNIGIRYALKNLNPNYILLLNNDTVVDRFFLNELIKTAKQDGSGIIGSKTYFYDSPELIQSVGIKINQYLGEIHHIGYKKKDVGQYSSLKNLDSVSGCSMLIKPEVIQKAGLFDPLFHLYYEDIDLCTRARSEGYNISCSTSSKLWHKSAVSSRKVTGVMEFYSARNQFLFIKKHYTSGRYLIFLIYFFFFRFWLTSAIIILYHQETSVFIPFINGVIAGVKI